MPRFDNFRTPAHPVPAAPVHASPPRRAVEMYTNPRTAAVVQALRLVNAGAGAEPALLAAEQSAAGRVPLGKRVDAVLRRLEAGQSATQAAVPSTSAATVIPGGVTLSAQEATDLDQLLASLPGAGSSASTSARTPYVASLAGEGAAHYQQWQSLHAAGRGQEARAYARTHDKAIRAYSASLGDDDDGAVQPLPASRAGRPHLAEYERLKTIDSSAARKYGVTHYREIKREAA